MSEVRSLSVVIVVAVDADTDECLVRLDGELRSFASRYTSLLIPYRPCALRAYATSPLSFVSSNSNSYLPTT